MNGGAPPLQTSSSTSSTSTNVPLLVNRGKKRVALQDRDLEMLSLPSQDEPSYYDSPPNSPPPPPLSSSLAYPTSLIRLSTSSSSTVKVSNRGNKLDPSAPFLNPLKLGHHSQLATTDESCLKKRKLNDLSSSSTKDGFLICPNLQLLPKKTILGIGGSKDAELYRDGTTGTGGGGFPSFLPLPPQSPLDLILLPHIQYTFSSNSSKNKTFHLLSESCTRLIEQESELVANLKKVCSGLRGEGFEWRWIGDDTREIERRNRRELRDKNLELERVEREKLRKQERDKVLKERKERKEREKLEREERQRIAAAEQEAEEQKKKEQELREEEEEESRKRQQQQDSIVKPEPDQTPTIQPAQPVSGAQYAQGIPLNDVEMNDSSSSSIPTPSTLLTTMPTPSSLPSLPLPPAPPQQQEQEEEDTPMSISNENTSSLAPTNPLSQPPQTSISSTAIENVNNGETKEEEEGGTSTITSVSSQQQPPMERVEEGQNESETTTTTTNPLPPPSPSSPVPNAPSTEVTNTKESTPVASTSTTTTTEINRSEELQQQEAQTTIESQSAAAETITSAVQEQEQGQEQDSQPQTDQPKPSNEVVETEPEPEPTVEPSIRRSGRQTRATVGLRASQLLFEDGGSVASNSLVGGVGRGMSYSPDPYGLAITGGNNNSRFGGVGHHHQTEEVESDSTPRSSNNGNRGQQQQQQQQQQRREDQEEEEESDLEGFEQEEEGEEELPLIPEEDIPEYAHRLIDPEKYVKQLFVSDEPVELEKTAFGNCGAVEILSTNEQEALVHECLTDLHRFLSDTLEYRDRLSEIRDGVLEVERRRKGMWKVVRTVALDWLEEEAAGGGIGGAGTNGVNGAGTATGYEGYE